MEDPYTGKIFLTPQDLTGYTPLRVKYSEIITDNLSEAGWSLGCVSAVDAKGRTIWIADAHRDDGKRFVVRSDEKLSAFVELERQVLTVTFYLESIHADSCR